MDDTSLRSTIETLWDMRDTLSAATAGEPRDAVEAALEALTRGVCVLPAPAKMVAKMVKRAANGPCMSG